MKVACRLSEETKPAAVYSSDLMRATETAQMISAASDSDVSSNILEQLELL